MENLKNIIRNIKPLFDVKYQPGSARVRAQRALIGLTHYVDEDTLRFFGTRVLTANPVNDGLFYLLVESSYVDHNKTEKGVKYVLYDVFGNVAMESDRIYKSDRNAKAAFWEHFSKFDQTTHYAAALDTLLKQAYREFIKIESAKAQLSV